MSLKLNQVTAIVKGEKSKMEAVKTKVHHMLLKDVLLKGVSKKYQPFSEDPLTGEEPSFETKNVQFTVAKGIKEIVDSWKTGLNLVATQDKGNCAALASIKIGSTVIAEAVPVTHLIYLEKQMIDLGTFLAKLPELDPGDEWEYDTKAGAYKSSEKITYKTKKAFKNHVKAEATDKHPAQVETYTEDIPIGKYIKYDFSGNIHKADKEKLLNKIEEMKTAVKLAREEANSIEVTKSDIGDKVLGYIFE